MPLPTRGHHHLAQGVTLLSGKLKLVHPLTIVGGGQCHTRAKQPKTAIGRARAHRSGSRHDQRENVVKRSSVDRSRGGHRQKACAPASVQPAYTHTGGELWWLWTRERIALPIPTAETTEQRRRSHFSLVSQHYGRQQCQQMRQVRGWHTTFVPCQ